MQGKKRRPTSTSKTHRLRTEEGSHVSHAEYKVPSPSLLIRKKYYQPVIQEEQRHQAYMLTRFLRGTFQLTQGPDRRTGCILPSCFIFTAADKTWLTASKSPKKHSNLPSSTAYHRSQG